MIRSAVEERSVGIIWDIVQRGGEAGRSVKGPRTEGKFVEPRERLSRNMAGPIRRAKGRVTL